MKRGFSRKSKAEGLNPFRLFAFAVCILALDGCSITKTRPVQEMSDTTAALRAAREVQAPTLAPELFRQAQEWFIRARREYRLKNFQEASEYAERSRAFAEQAEFEAIRNGANRESLNVPPPPPPPAPDATAGAEPPEIPSKPPPPGGGPGGY